MGDKNSSLTYPLVSEQDWTSKKANKTLISENLWEDKARGMLIRGRLVNLRIKGISLNIIIIYCPVSMQIRWLF